MSKTILTHWERWKAVWLIALCLPLASIAISAHHTSAGSQHAGRADASRANDSAGLWNISAATAPRTTMSWPEQFGESDDEQVVTAWLLAGEVGLFACDQQTPDVSLVERPFVLTARDRCVLLCRLTL